MFRRAAPWVLLAFVCVVTGSVRAQSQAPPREETKPEELPQGEGKAILQRACTTCHDLVEVTKFRAYYTRDDWRDIVVTMVKYGAELKDGEPEVLINYLGEHFSRKESK